MKLEVGKKYTTRGDRSVLYVEIVFDKYTKEYPFLGVARNINNYIDTKSYTIEGKILSGSKLRNTDLVAEYVPAPIMRTVVMYQWFNNAGYLTGYVTDQYAAGAYYSEHSTKLESTRLEIEVPE